MTSDTELLRAVQQGEPAAVKALYERYLPSLWRYALAQLRGDWHAAEDIVSETFLAFIRQARKIEADGRPLGPWLTAVARRKLADHWNAAKKNGSLPADVADAADSQTAAGDAGNQVAAAMTALDDEQRLVLEWKYLEGLSVRVIAERLGKTEKAVESILFRARKAFRAACGPDAGANNHGG